MDQSEINFEHFSGSDLVLLLYRLIAYLVVPPRNVQFLFAVVFTMGRAHFPRYLDREWNAWGGNHVARETVCHEYSSDRPPPTLPCHELPSQVQRKDLLHTFLVSVQKSSLEVIVNCLCCFLAQLYVTTLRKEGMLLFLELPCGFTVYPRGGTCQITRVFRSFSEGNLWSVCCYPWAFGSKWVRQSLLSAITSVFSGVWGHGETVKSGIHHEKLSAKLKEIPLPFVMRALTGAMSTESCRETCRFAFDLVVMQGRIAYLSHIGMGKGCVILAHLGSISRQKYRQLIWVKISLKMGVWALRVFTICFGWQTDCKRCEIVRRFRRDFGKRSWGIASRRRDHQGKCQLWRGSPYRFEKKPFANLEASMHGCLCFAACIHEISEYQRVSQKLFYWIWAGVSLKVH